MKILITGGTGVNGAATARLLVSRGQRPVLLDNRVDMSLIADIAADVDVVTGDILDGAALREVVAAHGITHIVHMAALMPGPAEANPALAIAIGVDGTLNVLEAARAGDIQRVVYTSSNAFIGDVRGKHGHPEFVPLDESLPPNPADMYGVTKVCSETLGNYYRKRYGVDFVALRYPSIYGPGKLARHGVLALYGKVIEDAMAGREFSIPRGGDQRNDVVYVGDVAHSIVLALNAEGLTQGTFNIGTGRGVTLKDFAAVLKRHFPDSSLDIGPGLDFREGYKQSYCIFDIGKAREQLGYSPQYDLERGIGDYIESIRKLDLPV
ncbi:MAG: NAD-dependent epimerase/dehydratase family protein [Deltaproteobacteria bacterium]|nr:NAD-dependent epimerase/dehydratase family protein [Deltaproteobacteria bacterium]